ncbi:hypothetical protein EfmAA610_28660 [Enterococcus faecium]|nr:hypothetical protein EfmAA610_28660 [Enterococcus faecium]
MIELPEDLIVSSIYPSYFHEQGFVLRLANPTEQEKIVPDLSCIQEVKIMGIEFSERQMKILYFLIENEHTTER